MKITITRGATVNLGNFESARVDLSVEVDAGMLSEGVKETDDCVKDWLSNSVLAIQDAAGLPPRPAERFVGGEETE